MNKSLFARFFATIVVIALTSSSAYAQELSQQFHQALANDPNYGAVLKRHTSTLALDKIADAAFIPTLSGNASATQNLTTNQSSDAYSVTLGLNLAMQAVYAMDSAEASIKASEYELAATKQTLMANTIKNYFAVVKAQVKIDSINAQIRSAKQNLAKIRKQRELGLVTPLQAANVENNVQQLYLNLLQAQQNLQTNRHTLSLSSGQPVTQNLPGVPLFKELPSLPNESLNYWWELAEQGTFSLLAQQFKSQKSYHDYRQAYSKHFPTGRIEAKHNSVLNDSVTFSISGNFFDGGITSAQAEQSLLNWRATQDTLKGTIDNTKQQLNNQLLSLDTNKSQIDLLQDLVVSSEDSLAATQKEYELGTKEMVNVLEAEQKLATNQVNLAVARYDRLVFQANVLQLAGSLDKVYLDTLDKLLQ